MRVGFWEEEKQQQSAAATESSLEPEDDTPGAECDNDALFKED